MATALAHADFGCCRPEVRRRLRLLLLLPSPLASLFWLALGARPVWLVILRLLRLAVGTLGVFSALLVEPTVEETAPRRLPGPEARLLWLLLLTMVSGLCNVGTGPPRRQAT